MSHNLFIMLLPRPMQCVRLLCLATWIETMIMLAMDIMDTMDIMIMLVMHVVDIMDILDMYALRRMLPGPTLAAAAARNVALVPSRRADLRHSSQSSSGRTRAATNGGSNRQWQQAATTSSGRAAGRQQTPDSRQQG